MADAFKDFGDTLLRLSQNAVKLGKELDNAVASVDELRQQIVEGMRVDALSIIQTELTHAISLSDEYNHPEFMNDLLRVFSNPKIIRVTPRQIEIDAHGVAGSWSELEMGIEAARDMLDIGGRLPPQKASDFWRERIYRPAREGLQRPRMFKKLSKWSYYKTGKGRQTAATFDYRAYGVDKYYTTLRARKQAWGSLAPYWLWLNYGNQTDGGRGGRPYPPGKATYFVEKAQVKINELYRERLLQFTEQFIDAVGDEVIAFLENPTTYEPGQILGEFIGLQGTYRVTAGKGGRIRLQSVE